MTDHHGEPSEPRESTASAETAEPPAPAELTEPTTPAEPSEPERPAATGAPNRRALAMVVVPIVALVVASNIGNALAPSMLVDPNDPNRTSNPLLLLALTPQIRNQVGVVNYVEQWQFLLVGGLRLLIPGPLFYLLGRWYGDAAIRWAERRSPTGGQLLRDFEGLFAIARIPIVLLSRNNLVALLAGASGMGWVMYLTLNVVGTFARLVLIIIFGEAFASPIDVVLGWIGEYRPYVLAVTVGVVVIGATMQLRRGTGELGQLRRLEHDLANADDPATGDHSGSRADSVSDTDSAVDPEASSASQGDASGDDLANPTASGDTSLSARDEEHR